MVLCVCKTLTMTSQSIRLAVDSLIFTVRGGELEVLLIQMKKAPYAGMWAFPGGQIEPQARTEASARSILKKQTGITDVYLEQLGTFDDVKRDVLGRVVSVAYMALVPSENVILKTTDRYADVKFWPVRRLPKLAYDHGTMAKVALERLRNKIEYTNIVWSLVPEEFTLTELQNVYEAILGRELDKRNFRRKIIELGMVKANGHTRKGASHRPAKLYQFKDRTLKYLNVL